MANVNVTVLQYTKELNGKRVMKPPIPEIIVGDFICERSRLDTLVGGPKKIEQGSYYAGENNLSTLEGVATNINVALNVSINPITNLIGVHKQLKHCRRIELRYINLLEGGLGLLLISELRDILYSDNDFAQYVPLGIISKYLNTGKSNIFRCQKELIDIGYEEIARL